MKTLPSIRIVGRGGKAKPAQRRGSTACLGLVICKVATTCLFQRGISTRERVSKRDGDGEKRGETVGWKLENERRKSFHA
jgi:hypothetical protein